MEIWKDIPGYEGRYQASDLGRVRSVDREVRTMHRGTTWGVRRILGRVLVPQPQNSGYLLVHLYAEGRRRALTVHTLVARTFIPNPLKLPEVNHRDTNKSHCEVDNLEWSSSSGNKRHALANGLLHRAIRVKCPTTGRIFNSINEAARVSRCRVATVRAGWERV